MPAPLSDAQGHTRLFCCHRRCACTRSTPTRSATAWALRCCWSSACCTAMQSPSRSAAQRQPPSPPCSCRELHHTCGCSPASSRRAGCGKGHTRDLQNDQSRFALAGAGCDHAGRGAVAHLLRKRASSRAQTDAWPPCRKRFRTRRGDQEPCSTLARLTPTPTIDVPLVGQPRCPNI